MANAKSSETLSETATDSEAPPPEADALTSVSAWLVTVEDVAVNVPTGRRVRSRQRAR